MPRIIDAFTQFFDDNGDPLVNGKLRFFVSGTNNTDKDTFADINETIPNTNPVILSATGRCPNVFGAGSYNVISYTSDDVQIQQFDPVSGDTLEGALSDWNAITIYDEGDLVTGSDGLYYRSLSSSNQNQNPISTPSQWEEVRFVGVWNTNITYDAGDTVYGSDGILYYSLINVNLANDPTTDDINWRSYLFNTSPNIVDNIGFTATIATKALTFDLKTKGLTDPTALDSVKVAFRSETETTGDYDIVDAIAATTLVVPSGATLGFDAVEDGYIYLYALSNAGELELAASKKALFDESTVHSTTAIDATADSGDVLYSTTARTDVPVKLIGRIQIVTGAVAGEWDNAPTELTVWTPAMKKTEDSTQEVLTEYNTSVTYTTPAIIPLDNTTPQNTEGASLSVLDTVFTPRKAGSKIVVEISAGLAFGGGAEQGFLCLFKDADASALKVTWATHTAASVMVQHTLRYEMIAPDTTAITFKPRFGGQAGNTFYLNSYDGNNYFNSTLISYLKVTEIVQ